MLILAGHKGFLVIDDTDRLRARDTSKLYGVHKVKNKKTGGFAKAQNLVFLVLVTNKLTIPVGFAFYRPDPALTEWAKEDKKLRKEGVTKKERPAKPERSSDFPTRSAIGARLVSEFHKAHPDVTVDAVIADSAYFTNDFISGVEGALPNVAIISEIPSHYKLKSFGNSGQPAVRVDRFFESSIFSERHVKLRGGTARRMRLARAEVFVPCRGRRMTAVYAHFDDEDQGRILACTRPGYRSETIVQAYGLRWLVEVVIQDWKEYDGWGRWSLQRGDEGACSSVILSLVADHLLLSHPLQQERLKAENRVYSAGSIRRYLRDSSVLEEVKACLHEPDPKTALKTLAERLLKVVDLIPSDKHMSGHESVVFRPLFIWRGKSTA